MKKPKEARLVVRNIPFKASEDEIKKHFSKYGNVVEVHLLRKGEKMVGCGFVQFDNKMCAAKAISKLSGKPFLGRIIVIDWAVSKHKYSKTKNVTGISEEKNIKSETEEDGGLNIKKEECSDTSSVISDVDEVVEKKNEGNKHNKRPISGRKNDENGCTIFFRNIPFSATNKDLENLVLKFGDIDYALICTDPLTEHSKGSGFVKFKDKCSADACLMAGVRLNLMGFILEPKILIPKDQLEKKMENHSVKKDKRNLYLAKEGVILPGTPAALGVSNADMSTRMELENWKSQKLRNLNMFVSETRLIVHNIPPHITDGSLRRIFKQHLPNITPCEVKIIRNLHDLDEKGFGKSKGYGFVGYNSHIDALSALRKINNNPQIFTEAKRPIVSFSIENKKVIKMKQSRIIKSQCKIKKTCEMQNISSDLKEKNTEDSNSFERDCKYGGMKANFGSKKLFSKYELKKKMHQHIEENKKLKATKQSKKSRRIQRIKKVKDNSPKKKERNSDLIEKYKKMICNPIMMKKWYE